MIGQISIRNFINFQGKKSKRGRGSGHDYQLLNTNIAVRGGSLLRLITEGGGGGV